MSSLSAGFSSVFLLVCVYMNSALATLKEWKMTIIAVFVVIVGIFGLVYAMRVNPNAPEFTFAQCLKDKGAKMYGAFWCPHCQSQKRLFGSAFKNIDYRECGVPGNTSAQTQECTDAKVQSYPTWEFADGSRVTGEQSFAALAEKSGCEFKSE
jgi:glutaredoxin